MKRRTLLNHLSAALLLATGGAVLSAGCSETRTPRAQFHALDISDADYAADFKLTDFNGRTRTLGDFRGQAVLVFFGYTQCPDVCPMTLSEMAHVKQLLGADGDRFQVLFVSLDPERDTPDVLRAYMQAFDADFLGLYADSGAALLQLTRDFKVFYEKVDGRTPGNYTINHSTASYVYDPEGKLRLFVRYETPADEIAKDIRLLLRGA